MGALEEAHLAAAACGCDDDDDEDLVVRGDGGGKEEAGDAMEAAVRALLVGLGEDDRREGLRRTPKRVAKAFRDGTRDQRSVHHTRPGGNLSMVITWISERGVWELFPEYSIS